MTALTASAMVLMCTAALKKLAGVIACIAIAAAYWWVMSCVHVYACMYACMHPHVVSSLACLEGKVCAAVRDEPGGPRMLIGDASAAWYVCTLQAEAYMARQGQWWGQAASSLLRN